MHLSLPAPVAHSLGTTISPVAVQIRVFSHLKLNLCPKLVHKAWLLYPLSSLSVDAARKPQHVLESASAPASLLITRLFSPQLFPIDMVWFAYMPEGRRCLPCFSIAEPCELNSSMWVGSQAEINHSVSKEILFSALFKALNHKMQGPLCLK